jgi:hypothetical protein
VQIGQNRERLSLGVNDFLQRLHGRGFPFLPVGHFRPDFASGGFSLVFSSWICCLTFSAAVTSGSSLSDSSYFWRISSVSFARISSGGSMGDQERDNSSCEGGGVFCLASASLSETFFVCAMVWRIMI